MAKNKLLILLIIFIFTQNAYSSNQQSSGSSNQINSLQQEVDDWYYNKLMPQFNNKALKTDVKFQNHLAAELKESANFFAKIPQQAPNIASVVHSGHPFISHCLYGIYPNSRIAASKSSNYLMASKQDDSFEQWRKSEKNNVFFKQKIIPIVHQLLIFKQKQATTNYNINVDTMHKLFTERFQINNFFDRKLEERAQQEKEFCDIIEAEKQDFEHLTKIIEKRPEFINALSFKEKVMHQTIYFTPLMYATKHNNLALVKYFLEHNAAINAENEKGYTALTYAQPKKHFNVVKLLLERGAKRCCESHRPECFSEPSCSMLKHPPFLSLKVRILNFIREHNGSHAKNEHINTSQLPPLLLQYPKVVDPAFEERIESYHKALQAKEIKKNNNILLSPCRYAHFLISSSNDEY